MVTVLIVSDFELKEESEVGGNFYEDPETKGIKVSISVASGQKCERCWMISESVGKNETHETLCDRCAKVVG
jgi:isoleucyl-tRNA synthetase